MGSADLTSVYREYTFQFSSQTNKDLFDASPSTYQLAYGGFCSYGVANEFAPDWDWSADFMGPPPSIGCDNLINGKLHVFLSGVVAKNFRKDYDTYNTVAADRWVEYYGSDSDSGPINTLCFGDLKYTGERCGSGEYMEY